MVIMENNNKRTKANNCVFSTLGASNHTDKERQEHDYYATEPKGRRATFRTGEF